MTQPDTKVDQAIREIERVENELNSREGVEDLREQLTEARAELVDGLLEEEVESQKAEEASQSDQLDTATRTRMLTLTVAAMTWATATAGLMQVTGLFNAVTALAVGPGISFLAFCGYLYASRSGAIPEQYEGKFPFDDPVLALVVTILVTSIFWAIWKYITVVSA